MRKLLASAVILVVILVSAVHGLVPAAESQGWSEPLSWSQQGGQSSSLLGHDIDTADVTPSTGTDNLQEKFLPREVVVLPRGSGTGQVGIEEGPHGEPPVGPTSLLVTESDELLLLDSVNHRILVFSTDGRFLRDMQFSSNFWGTDLAVDHSGQIYVLDAGASSILILGTDSPEPQTIQLPLERDFQANRLAVGLDGMLNLEGWQLPTNGESPRQTAVAISISDLRSGRSSLLVKEYPNFQNTRLGLSSARLIQSGEYSAQLVVDQRSGSRSNVSIKTALPLIGTTFIDYDVNANLYVYVLTSAPTTTGRLYYGTRVDKYSPDGRLAASIPLPMALFSVPERPLVITEEGSIYQLAVEPDSVRIIKWEADTASLQLEDPPDVWAPIHTHDAHLSGEQALDQSYSDATALALSPITRDQIMSIARDYASHSWTVGAANYYARECNSCPVGPSAWPIGTQVTGVAYMWGGWDSVSGFDLKLSQGRLAGDVTGTACVGWDCVTGVDCSGFVQQTWQIVDSKHSSSQLMSDTYSQHIEWSDLQKGDALGIAGVHITLYSNRDAEGRIAIYESVYGAPHKVRYFVDTWGYLNGYEARRRYDISDVDTTPPDGDYTSPVNGATITGRTVRMAAWATDNSSGVRWVRFNAKWDGLWRTVHEDSSSPYEFDWDLCVSGVPDGDVELSLHIQDNAGNDFFLSDKHANPHVTKSYDCTPPCSPPSSPTLGSPANGAKLFPEDSLVFSWSGNASEYQVHWWGGPGGDHYSDWMSATSWNVGQQWESANKYYWAVRGRNGEGCEGPWSSTREFMIGPKAPTNLSATTTSCSQINLSWLDNATTESDYHLERSADGSNWQGIAEIGGSSYQDTGLAPSTTYYYRARAHRHSDNTYSKFSNTATRATSSCPPPDPPTLLSPQNGEILESDTSVVLAWNASAGAVEYYAHLWGGPGIDINSGWIAARDWQIGTQWPGSYQWQVKSRNGTGESGWSSTWTYTVAAPAVELVESLTLLPSAPLAGEEVESRFTIRNPSNQPVTLERLLVGVHGPDCPDWECPAADFFHEENLTLQPGQVHTYSHTRVFPEPGQYMIVPMYVDNEGQWKSLAEQSNFTVSPGLEVVQALSLSPAEPLKDQMVTAQYGFRNLGTRTISLTAVGLIARGPNCSDWECPANVDFPVHWNIALQPGQEYDYTEQQSFYTVGDGYFAEPAFRDSNDRWYPISGGNRLAFSVFPGLEVVQALSLSPENPQAGEEVRASMVIRNASDRMLTLERLLVGVHGPDCATWECADVADFLHEENLTLQPGDEHSYSYTRIFPEPGEYMVVPLYVDADGYWHSLEPQGSFTVSPGLEVDQALSLSPATPVAGQQVTATYSIRNSGARSLTIPWLSVVARGPDCTDWDCLQWTDFPTIPGATLQPGDEITYTGQRAFDWSGTGYFAEPAYADSNNWYYPIGGGSRVSFTVEPASAFCANVTQVPEAECLALERLYQATNGSAWTEDQGWMADYQPCTWHGVVCDNGHVVALDLAANGLEGPIPPELDHLSQLTWLVLNDNQLAGPIPTELAALSNLRSLHLTGNMLSGEIPAELASLVNLRELGMGSNELTGGIPPELGNLTNLERLWLDHNALSGTIPPDLGNLANLQHLVLGQNQLTGAIPPELGNAQNLQILTLWVNQLTGGLPVQLTELGGLEVLALSENQLSGTIPSSIGNLTGLKELYLNHNEFTGEIPSEIGNLTSLTMLALNSNQLGGSIPTALGNMNALQELHLDDNQLSGVIPSQLGDLTALQGIWLHQNHLSGEIPPELGNLANLEALHLGENQLVGPIPAALGTLSKLRIIILWANQLSGNIPSELGDLSNLEMLHLEENELQGTIPPEIGSLTKLSELGLGSNLLSGQIPSELGNLVSLQKLWLDNNQLDGSIPANLGNLDSLQHLVLGFNRLSGAIPQSLCNLPDLEILILWENELTDSIPSDIGALAHLKVLGLSANNLSGTIPAELGGLTDLEELYLSENRLGGAIPPGLANLVQLKTLGLGNNALTGEVPALLTQCAQIDTLDLGYNMLTASGTDLISFLDARDPDWRQTQTVPPSDLSVSTVLANSIELAWSPIDYVGDGGYYEIAYAISPGSEYLVHGQTADKATSSYLVDGLQAGTSYDFVVRAYTPAHDNQANALLSGFSQPVSATPGSGQVCYELVVEVSPDNGGTVAVTPPPNCGDGYYVDNTTVELTANPDPGFVFDSWSGSVSGSQNPVELTIDSSSSVTAGFLPASGPVLQIPDRLPAYAGGTASVTLHYSGNAFDIASLTFSIDFDQSCLAFDPTDADADGVPDSIVSHQPPAFGLSTQFDEADLDGEIDVLLADLFPPLSALVDGDLVTISFDVLCEPEPGETIVASVDFSTDPAASFGDTAGQSIPGATVGGSIEIQSSVMAGDCNNDHVVDAGDISAVVLEIFDGDGTDPAHTPGGTFGGSLGCDANGDNTVDAGDISCTVLTIFGGSGACTEQPDILSREILGEDLNSEPLLSLPVGKLGESGGSITVPITFTSGGEEISSLVFSVDYDQQWLALDPADDDGDGIPDSVSLNLPAGFHASISLDPDDADGEIDVFIGDLTVPLTHLPDGELLYLTFDLADVTEEILATVRFSQNPAPSFGSVDGASIPGMTSDGSISITNRLYRVFVPIVVR